MRYIAFLRAINVGGHVVKMERLRTLFEELKLAKVETFIASGNVIFESTAAPTSLETRIEQHLVKALGYPVPTFIRAVEELPAIMTSHPFAARRANAHGLYVGFLKAADAMHEGNVKKLESAEHSFHVDGRHLYWLSQISTADSKLSGSTLERALRAQTTMRNITSLEKLAQKVGVTV